MEKIERPDMLMWCQLPPQRKKAEGKNVVFGTQQLVYCSIIIIMYFYVEYRHSKEHGGEG